MPRPKNDPGFPWDGRMLYILRYYSGRTLIEFANEMGYAETSLRYYERNNHAPTRATVQDLGFMFGWEAEELVAHMNALSALLASMKMRVKTPPAVARVRRIANTPSTPEVDNGD